MELQHKDLKTLTKPSRPLPEKLGTWVKWMAVGGVMALALLLLVVPNQAEAGLFDFGYYVLGKIALGISYIVSWIAAVAIAVLAWFIEIILRLNTDIINSPPVRFGFPVALSVANLGFVLAIIIMAIATILRLESYAMKQILWKLVVAALLVNFSLVFAGAILNLADQLTLYFINQMSPGGVGETQNFANAVAGAFNPQQLVLLSESELNPSKVQDFESKVDQAGGSFAVDNESLGKMLVPIASLVFTGVSMIVIVITLLGMVIMLLVRYVFLGILLIIMPLAWLAWIFPALKSNWGKWWKNFWKWTFFAPLMVLFLYIGVQTSLQLPQDVQAYQLAGQSTGTGAWAAIQNFFSELLSPIVQVILQQFVIVGIMVGGLFAANSLSITGAHGALGAAKGAAGGLGKWAGAQTGGRLARFATQQKPPPLPQPPPNAGGFKRGLYGVSNAVRKFGRSVVRPARTATNAVTKTILPKEAYSGLAKFGAESKKVTLGGAIFAGIGKGSGLWGKKKVKTKYSKKEKEEFLKEYGLNEEQFEELGFEEEHGEEHEEGESHEEGHREESHAPKIQVVGSRVSVRDAAGHSNH